MNKNLDKKTKNEAKKIIDETEGALIMANSSSVTMIGRKIEILGLLTLIMKHLHEYCDVDRKKLENLIDIALMSDEE